MNRVSPAHRLNLYKCKKVTEKRVLFVYHNEIIIKNAYVSSLIIFF